MTQALTCANPGKWFTCANPGKWFTCAMTNIWSAVHKDFTYILEMEVVFSLAREYFDKKRFQGFDLDLTTLTERRLD